MDSVKVKFQAQECIPPDLQRLTSSGKQLEDARMGGGQWHDRHPQGEDPAQGGHLGGQAAQDLRRRATSGERPSQRGGTGRVRPTQRGGTGRVRPTQRGETLMVMMVMMGMMVMMRRYAEHYFVAASALKPAPMGSLKSRLEALLHARGRKSCC